jgi:hypothetical protein
MARILWALTRRIIEGPIQATREGGGSEWEPIKILPFG